MWRGGHRRWILPKVESNILLMATRNPVNCNQLRLVAFRYSVIYQRFSKAILQVGFISREFSEASTVSNLKRWGFGWFSWNCRAAKIKSCNSSGDTKDLIFNVSVLKKGPHLRLCLARVRQSPETRIVRGTALKTLARNPYCIRDPAVVSAQLSRPDAIRGQGRMATRATGEKDGFPLYFGLEDIHMHKHCSLPLAEMVDLSTWGKIGWEEAEEVSPIHSCGRCTRWGVSEDERHADIWTCSWSADGCAEGVEQCTARKDCVFQGFNRESSAYTWLWVGW